MQYKHSPFCLMNALQLDNLLMTSEASWPLISPNCTTFSYLGTRACMCVRWRPTLIRSDSQGKLKFHIELNCPLAVLTV